MRLNIRWINLWLLLIASVCCQPFAIAQSRQPDVRLVIPDVEIQFDKLGIIPVYIDNALPVGAFQMDLQLPAGISPNGAIINAERAESFSVTQHDFGSGHLRILGYSQNEQPLAGSDGVAFYIQVSADNTCAVGSTLPMTLQDVTVSTIIGGPMAYSTEVGDVQIVAASGRNEATENFLKALFNGKKYPVALHQSESYPWRVDSKTVKTTCRQNDVMSNCWFALDVYVPADSASVSFDYNVRYHKEQYGWAKYANLSLCIDDVKVFGNNGTDGVQNATVKIGKGYHTLKWNLYLGEAWENWDYFASIQNMQFEGLSSITPLAELSKISVPFYNIGLNASKRDTIAIANEGFAPLKIDNVYGLKSPFSVVEGVSQTIEPGQSGNVIVSFCPDDEGYYDSEMIISTNVGDYTVRVDGMSTDGYVVVSTRPGNLSSVLKNINSEEITIMGHLNREDQYLFAKLKDCRYLNLAGTDIEVVTNGGLNNLWKLRTLVLPKTLKVLDTTWTNQATYEGNTWVNLFDLTSIMCLSPMPPKVYEFYPEGGDTEKNLGNLRETTRLLVPEEYYSEYTSNPIWNKLTLVPINNDRNTLRVELKLNDEKKYSGMSLVLRNCNTYSDESITLNSSSDYAFMGLRPYYGYEVSLQDQYGRVLGSVNDIALSEPVTTVSMDGIKDVLSAKCSVVDDNLNDVSDRIGFEWSDATGKILSTDAEINGIVSGDSLVCKLSLPEDLGKVYINPSLLSLKLTETDTLVVCQLKQIPEVALNGIVRNAVNKKPVSNVSLLFSQYLNGKFCVTSKVSTDDNGKFTVALKNDSTALSVVMSQYDTYKVDLPNLSDTASLSEIFIQPCDGVPVNVRFAYQPSVAEGDIPSVDSWYGDYNNVTFSAHNVTTDTDINKLAYNYPTLSLLDNCAVGDSIVIVAKSKKDSFYPVEGAFVVDTLGMGFAHLQIVEYGVIQASYLHSDDSGVMGFLFSDNGFAKSASYNSSKIEFDNLQNGKYTLVSMGANEYYTSIPSLNTLREYKLKEGEDYVKSEIEVCQGLIKEVAYDTIPKFNSDLHRLTNSGTYLKANKSSVVVGSYITIDSKVGFVSSIDGRVKDVSLVFDLPKDATFVKNSLLIGSNSSTNYKINGSQLEIPLKKLDERIRFCLQPLHFGDYIAGGSVRFTLDDNQMTQPIGSASFNASNITIAAPSTTPYQEITVSGNTVANADITIYDNDVPVGSAKASGSGVWQTKVMLDNPYNLSKHRIYAEIETSESLVMQSEVKDVLYDKNVIAVKKVIMHHDNPEIGKTFAVEFNFINPSSITDSYTYYIYNKNFTFTIDLTDNTSDRIKDVILWVETGKGNEIGLDAKFDESTGLWVASGKFGNMYDGDIPVNVSVSILQDPVLEVDQEAIDTGWKNHVESIENYLAIQSYGEDLLVRLNNEINKENPDESVIKDILNQSYSRLNITEDSNIDSEYVDRDEFMNGFDKWCSEIDEYYNKMFTTQPNVFDSWSYEWNNYIFTITVAPCSKTQAQYLSDNYNPIQTTRSNIILMKYIHNGILFADCLNGFEYTCSVVENSKTSNVSRGGDDIDWQQLLNDLTDEMIKGTGQKLIESIVDSFLKYNSDTAKYYQDIVDNFPDKPTIDKYKKLADKYGKLERLFYKLKNFLNSISAGQTLGHLIGDFIEMKNMLKILDGLDPSDVNQCAWNLYPDEIEDMFLDIIKTRQEIKRRTFSLMTLRIFQETVGQLNIIGDAAEHGMDNVIMAAATEITASSIFSVTLDEIINNLRNENWDYINGCIKAINNYNEICTDDEKRKYFNDATFESNCPNAPTQIDPSGYVYESVPSNRLQGVKATCFQKVESENMYGDIIEKAVVWNASNFEQKNPLYTDENGFYRWDVPEGLWQVKFEKDGYETALTEWLPVPPPQLDINIPMVRRSQPRVAKAVWTDEGVNITFDKYMLPTTIIGNNISIMSGDKDVRGNIIFVDEEYADKANSKSYLSQVIVPVEGSIGDDEEIDLTVKANVKSYSGVTMGSDYTARLKKVPSVTDISAPDDIYINVDEYRPVHVAVASPTASAGKNLLISNSSPLICTTDEYVALDKNGEADIFIMGNVPGHSTLTLRIDGYDLVKSIPVVVRSVNDKVVSTPYASIDDDGKIEIGTEIYLLCDTEDAVIYYTLDGSCPCDFDKRIRYDGSPIVVEEDTEIRMIASKNGYEDSEINVYNYLVVPASINDINNDLEYGVYPKATHDYVYLNLNGRIASKVAVWGLDGGLIQAKSCVPDGSRVNLGPLPAGIYIIQLSVDGAVISEKVLKH